MRLPPLLRARSFVAQVVLAVVLPIAFGALCGAMLGSSAPLFNALMLLAGLGGIGAGFEHHGARDGVVRGLVGGALFTGALLVGFTVHGEPPRMPLPLPLAAMAVIYAATGMPLGALGGWLRRRVETRRARAELRA